MEKSYSGSCLCGENKFVIEGDFESFYLCHCTYCQKDTGSAHAANLFSKTAMLDWLTGGQNVRSFNLPGTRHTKSFCMNCGSALPSFHEKSHMLVVPAGCLETDVALKPKGHLFCSSRATWDHELETVPQFEKYPS